MELQRVFNSPIPEMSQSFSSCIARAVLVMSMDETDKSSLSAASEASGVATAASESEKPENLALRHQPYIKKCLCTF